MNDKLAGVSIAGISEAYEVAHSAAVLVERSDLGMLKFSGKSRLDLINRMSTQDVLNLKPGEGAATVLSTDIGRIIDRLILYVDRESVYCLTGEGNGANIAEYLRRFVFYMDDFTVEDLSASTAVLAVYGIQASSALRDIFGEADLPLHHWKRADLGGAPVYQHRTDPIAGAGYLVTCHEEDRAALEQALVGAPIRPADEAAFDYLRIESRLPRFGRELTPDYIPLEAGLWADVSFNKGCYTGQEIIARLESRGRLAKRLVHLTAAEPLSAGDALTAGDKAAGTVTSAATGPGGAQALAYVKTAILEQDQPLIASHTAVRVSS
ncbi:MAG: folate-binding protein YgfZ [Chloroflexota bacterium]|nr:MAG: folate-binding protein YgfZ [Chloroflexota bacterium]